MKSYQKIICAVFSILSILLILCLRSIPGGQLWKNYSVVYVPNEIADEAVISEFNKNNIQKVVSLGGQYLPILISENSPEYSMYKINSNNSDFAYSSLRNSYFFDKSNSYRLYYVPSEYKNKLSKCVSNLNSMGISAGVDSNSAYPWFVPVVCLIISIILICFAKKKILFVFGIIIPQIFIFCNPFYPIALSNVLIQLITFFICNLWNRKGVLQRFYTSIIITIVFVIVLICPFAISVKTGVIFIVALAGMFCMYINYFVLEKIYNSKQIFVPVLIRPARMISIFDNKQKSVLTSLTCGAIVIVLLFSLTSSESLNAHFSKLQLPSSSGIKAENLPDLENYYRWTWNIKTYPYKSLNKTSDNDEYVKFSKYVESNGKITEVVQTMTYDQNFKTAAYNEIDNLPFESIEKVLKVQNEDFIPGYSSTNTYHMGIFGIIMMIFCFGVLLFIDISIIIKKGARK